MRKTPWRRKWQPSSVALPGKFQGQTVAWWATVHGLQKLGHDCAMEHATPTGSYKAAFILFQHVAHLQVGPH